MTLKTVIITIAVLLNYANCAMEDFCQAPGELDHSIRVANDVLCGTICSNTPGCASYLFNDLENNEENCFLRNRYESNFLGETLDFDDDFKHYHCKISKDKNGEDVTEYVSIPRMDPTEEALSMGYNMTLKLEKQRTIKHIQILNEKLEYWQAERKCAMLDGFVLMEYNQEVTDQLIEMFGQDMPSLRHLPLRIANGTYKTAGYWPDGRME